MNQPEWHPLTYNNDVFIDPAAERFTHCKHTPIHNNITAKDTHMRN